MSKMLIYTDREYFTFADRCLRLVNHEQSELLSNFAARLTPLNRANKTSDIEIRETGQGLQCLWYQSSDKPLILEIDIEKFVNQQRSFPAPKQGALNQAVGRKSRSVIDATGGWGGDALLLCSQGYSVTILERNPLLALMLKDSIIRLQASGWPASSGAVLPQVVEVDAQQYFSADNALVVEGVDCVYLDPMFPAKIKTSAAVNKRMRFLQYLLGAEEDAGHLLTTVLNSHVQRVVVKRPHHASPLVREPEHKFSSKLVHYDLYLQNR